MLGAPQVDQGWNMEGLECSAQESPESRGTKSLHHDGHKTRCLQKEIIPAALVERARTWVSGEPGASPSSAANHLHDFGQVT